MSISCTRERARSSWRSVRFSTPPSKRRPARGTGVAYTATPVPLDRGGLRELSAGFDRVVVVEPFLEGTTAATVGAALRGSGVLIEHVGVGVGEQRRYGTPADHARLHGLDAPGIRRRLDRLS